MPIATYNVIPKACHGPSITTARRVANTLPKEAAFEAIAGVASNAIKVGHEACIHVPGANGNPSLGSP